MRFAWCYTNDGDYMKSVFKIVAVIIGAVIALNGIALFFVSNVNLGNFLSVLLGAVIIFIALYFKKLAKWLKILLVTGVSLAVVCSSFLIIYGKADNTNHNEDAVIVLGAAVHGKTPSLTLKKRLDKAIEYNKQNPDAIIVVSGGKGAQEDITEAEAMKNYLVENGVNPDKIIEEGNSTSTTENFKFSKEILDRHFDGGYTICFITNEYHIFRSSLCAKAAGYDDISYLHSNTNLSYMVSGSLRECLAVIYHIILG